MDHFHTRTHKLKGNISPDIQENIKYTTQIMQDCNDLVQKQFKIGIDHEISIYIVYYDSGFIWEYDFISGWRSKGYLIFQQIISDKRGTECGSGSGDRWSKGQFYGESEDEYGIDPQKDTGYEVKSDPEADRNEK